MIEKVKKYQRSIMTLEGRGAKRVRLICVVHIIVEKCVFSHNLFGEQARFAETEIFFAALH